jgi:hypothetical protein
LWEELLQEADKNRDGVISFDDFSLTMNEMVRKSWLRKCDRSPSKSPVKKFECSPDRENGSPTRGLIISPERNPFNSTKQKSPSPKKKEFSIKLVPQTGI